MKHFRMFLLWVVASQSVLAHGQDLLPYLSQPRVEPNPSLVGSAPFLVLTSNGCGLYEPDLGPTFMLNGMELEVTLGVVEPCALKPTSFELAWRIPVLPVGNYTLVYKPGSFSGPLPIETTTFSVVNALPVPSSTGPWQLLITVLLFLGAANLTTRSSRPPGRAFFKPWPFRPAAA